VIHVLLVDDHELVRVGINRLLADVPGIRVVGQAGTGEEAVKLAREKNPHVVLMDIKMPGIGGLEAIRKIQKINSDIKVIVLTVHTEDPFPIKLLRAGAQGYLTKEARLDEMVAAIQAVHAGKRYLIPEIAQQIALTTVLDNQPSLFTRLSKREMQVLLMITSGQKVKEISDKLCLSPKTINTYRYRLFEKLDASSDVELTHLAIRHGIVDTEGS